MNGEALVFEKVSRWYGDTVALADVSFALGPGVTGLLGHNGAGKSTALKLCAGFTQPSTGTVRVLGADLARDLDTYRRIGIAHDRDALWPFLTARAWSPSARACAACATPTRRRHGRWTRWGWATSPTGSCAASPTACASG